jgi:hypothetical protein
LKNRRETYTLSENAVPLGPGADVVVRSLLAACIVIPPLVMASWFELCPQYGNPGCPDTSNPLGSLVAFRTANPTWLHLFLVINVLAPYLFPLSYLALGLVAFRRAPVLATLGALCGWLGSAPWGLVTDRSFLLANLARLGNDGFSVSVLTRLNHQPEFVLMAAGWFFGHMLGYILLALALGRANAIPRWATWLMVIAVPVMGPLAYGTVHGSLQVLGFVLIAVASTPAAVTLLRLRHDHVPPDVVSSRTEGPGFAHGSSAPRVVRRE